MRISPGSTALLLLIISFREDVDSLFDDLAHLGISYADIRYSNIRRAPEHSLSSALPGVVSPRTGSMHEWRLFDLESCTKSNVSAEGIQFAHHGWVRRLLDNLPLGYIMEPWE